MSMLRVSLCVFALSLVTGCGIGPAAKVAEQSAQQVGGQVRGGQQPVSGATIQLYEVGLTGDGSAATALLSPAVMTNQTGGFNISTLYTCSPTNALVYLVATGGNPGMAAGTNNPNLVEMAALGACNALTTNTFVNINEVTTVAAVAALAPFMNGYASVGSGAYDTANLAAAFNLAAEYANVATGTSPGSGMPAGYTTPAAEINTLANVLSACVNSAGGTAGDTTLCGQLFTAVTPPSGVPPTDTVGAMLDLMNNPTLNASTLFGLSSSQPAFQPVLSQAPATFAVTPAATGGLSLQFSSPNVTFPGTAVGFTSAVQTVTITNNGAGTVSFSNFSLTGTNPAEFTQVSDCVTLAVGASCQVQLTATPSVAGTRTATLAVPSTATGAAQTMALSVVGGSPSAGPVTVSPSSLNWTVSRGVQDVTLTNNGTGPLAINTIRIVSTGSALDGGFSFISNTCGKILAAQSSCTMTVINSGSTMPQGVETATLTINDDAASGPQTVSLSANDTVFLNYPLGNMFLYPSNVGATEQSNTQVIVTPLSSTQTVSFTGSVTGPDASDFTQPNTLSSTPSAMTGCTGASPGASCSFYVDFTPGAAGVRTAEFGSTGGNLPLIGVGVDYGANPNFVLSGSAITNGPDIVAPTYILTAYEIPVLIMQSNLNAATGVASVTGTATITNTGSATVNIASFPIFSDHATYFNAYGNCTNLAPGANCTVTVEFTGDSAAAKFYTASMVVQDTISGNSSNLLIDVEDGLNATPTTLSFTAVAGTTSAAQTVTVTDGITNGMPDPITVTNASALPLQISTPVCATGSTTPTCTFTVAFAPTLLTPVESLGTSLTVTDTVTGGFEYAPGVSTTVTAPPNTPMVDLDYAGTPLNFGTQAQGTTQTTTTQVSNSGTAPLTISGISVLGATNGNFTQTNNCPATLAYRGESGGGATFCTVTVTFSPNGTGAQSATLQVLTNAATSPDTLTLMGTGQ